MGSYVSSFLSGLIFSLGLTISGMTLPHKVVGFLNVFQQWDVTLIFVMIGAILVHGISYFFIKRRNFPLLDTHFHLPEKNTIDRQLVIGSLLFGVGWALAGLCPGPAIVSIASGSTNIFAFIVAMVIGSLASKIVFR